MTRSMPVRCAHVARIEEVAPALPEPPLRRSLALADLGPAGDRLEVVELSAGAVEDAVAGLPRAQAVVDVLVAHRVALVEQADPIDQLPPDVHARARGRQHRPGYVRRPMAGRLEAIAVVEPLGSVAIAHGAGELDPVVGVEQLRADDADVFAATRLVLKARQPASAGDHVGVEHDDVVLRVRGAEPAVDVGREADVLVPVDDLGSLDPSQRGQVLGAARVVGDEDSHRIARPEQPAVGARRATDAPDEHAHVIRVAVTGDHDRHPPSVLAIPPQCSSSG